MTDRRAIRIADLEIEVGNLKSEIRELKAKIAAMEQVIASHSPNPGPWGIQNWGIQTYR